MPDLHTETEPSRRCPICSKIEPQYYTECYNNSGARLCSLWYCTSCRSFFPSDISIPSRQEESAIANASVEQRKSTRFDTWFVIEVLLENQDFSDPIVATVLNASSGGVFFPFSRELPMNSVARFRISLPSADRSFEAQGKVVRCSKSVNGQYGVAVRFTDVDSRYEAALDRYVRTGA